MLPIASLKKGAPAAPPLLPQDGPPMPPDQGPSPDMAGAAPHGPKMEIQKVAPMVAVYRTSDEGPFICSNCHYFDEDGSCALVDGPIDPEGVCNLFTSEGGKETHDDTQKPPDAGPPPPDVGLAPGPTL